ncbi:hypothetical protein [uncultured Campylobacter sp.]|uniref:hypothetical protein n=1 Tax=uncultured Campylobacter sp. TaxID=218934 RepID=UPI00262DC6C9|nr:hypothetical protein [uncultured Campylobacter sp.]
MPALLSALSWIFGRLKLGELAGFVIKKIAFSKIVLIEIAMFALMVIYFGALLAIANFLFGQLFDIFNFTKSLTSPTGGNEITSIALAVLSSLGVFKAFWDVFNLYAPIFISLFLMIGAKIGIKLLEKLRYSISGLIKTYV